jgi:thymidylate synthase
VNNSYAYEGLLADVLNNGVKKGDRTGTGTRSVFGRQIRYDLSKGFPLITSKRVHWKSVVGELLWFISGSTDVQVLQEEYGVSIWDEWAKEDGTIGPMYGKQWRDARGVATTETPWGPGAAITRTDQLQKVIEEIKANPDSRRLLVSAWNVGELPNMALAPCHFAFQFYVADGRLSIQVYQRSADMFLGVPFNLASYALLCHMVAAVTGLEVGDLVWTGGDCHIYENHVEQAIEQLSRTARRLPTLQIGAGPWEIDDFTPEDFDLDGYDPHPAIKGSVAV